MGYQNNDPRVIKARFQSKCSTCKKTILKGDEAFYWPIGKKIKCIPCGQPDYNDFILNLQDEEFFNRY